ncbi:Lipid A biosynthesis lauroyl acyltransferase [Chitinispirillum alkaliphilum]|nr:Lipid A biosynthesis lauroyl acyltransferase [Chitinispirillum alkaliphilum]
MKHTLFRKLSYYTEFALLRILQFFISALPRRAALFLGIIAGKVMYLCGIYRSVVIKNIQHTELIPDEKHSEFLKTLYRTMGLYLIDFLRNKKKLPPHRIHNLEIFTSSFSKNKGIIVLLAHFGNWELLADIFGSHIGKVNVVAKPMRNNIVESWLLKKRTSASVKTIYTNKGLRKMLGALKKNEMVAILIDQHFGKMGTPTPFLGKPANTVRTVAGLAHKTGAAVISVYALMNDDYSYDIRIKEIPNPDTTGLTEEAAISRIQHLHNDVLSELISNAPGHWFGWFHRRFKGYVKYR